MGRNHDLFTPIKVPSEKKKIFKALVDSAAELMMKGSSENLYRLRARSIAEGRWLTCAYEAGSEELEADEGDEVHSVNFSVGPERYFFQCQVQISAQNILLETDIDLYHLQRRKTLRIPLPAELDATANIINHKDHSCLIECRLHDFSSGGAKLCDPQNLLSYQINDRIILVLRLGHRKPFEMKAEIRHLMPLDKTGQSFGIQFIEKDRLTENKLLSLQMDLQAEIFRKWKRHQW